MASQSCVFCRIIAGQSPASIIYRDGQVVAFRDLHPVAPIHILIVPVQHTSSLDEIGAGEEAVLSSLLLTARDLAAQEGLNKGGYRLVLNTGADAGQSVFHLHLHLLGGRALHWPPG